MTDYRNQYDVSQTVDITDPKAVKTEVIWLLGCLYPGASTLSIERAFTDAVALYRGEFPGFQACDTHFHNLQHTLDVALAMARLMEGYERAQIGAARLGPSLFAMGIITALFHDCGYLGSVDDTRHSNGGVWTLTRASRGASFLKSYLPRVGLGEVADAISTLVHFTGYEMPVAHIPVTSFRFRVLGSLLGSADIIAEMADRCYLEKCRDRLYPELLAAGLVRETRPDGTVDVLFKSGDDLVMQTPRFYVRAMNRLTYELGACYRLAARAFEGQNLYWERMRRNARFAKRLKEKNDVSLLKRVAP